MKGEQIIFISLLTIGISLLITINTKECDKTILREDFEIIKPNPNTSSFSVTANRNYTFGTDLYSRFGQPLKEGKIYGAPGIEHEGIFPAKPSSINPIHRKLSIKGSKHVSRQRDTRDQKLDDIKNFKAKLKKEESYIKAASSQVKSSPYLMGPRIIAINAPPGSKKISAEDIIRGKQRIRSTVRGFDNVATFGREPGLIRGAVNTTQISPDKQFGHNRAIPITPNYTMMLDGEDLYVKSRNLSIGNPGNSIASEISANP